MKLKNSKHAVYTSVNLDYLSRALTLGESIKKFNKDIEFVVAIIETRMTLKQSDLEFLKDYESQNIIDHLIFLEDLSLELRTSLIDVKVTEACTAVKPFIAKHLFENLNFEWVTYLDPDIMVFGKLDKIRAQHGDDFAVLLTPHLSAPPLREWAIYNNEIYGSMKHGVFNLGFISFRNTLEAHRVINWWGERLLKYCREDYEKGIWTDQKWFDLATSYFDSIKIVKESGWNLATWNFDERPLTYLDKNISAGEDDLLFYHFSKYPSKGFDASKKAMSFNESADKIIIEYKSKFDKWQDLTKAQIINLSNLRISTRPTQNKAKWLSSILTYLVRNSKLRYLVRKNKKIFKFSKNIYFKLTQETNKQVSSFDFISVSDIELDLLYISHYGGGGVDEFVNSKISNISNGAKWGFIQPNRANKYNLWTNIYPLKILNIDELEILNLIEKSKAIEIHHLLGAENLRSCIIAHYNYDVYLHDRYFLTQKPFSDTLNYLDVLTEISGVNIPLNPDLEINDNLWLEQNRDFLNNARNIYAPSDYIRKAFQKSIPEIGSKIQVVEWRFNHLAMLYEENQSSNQIKKIYEVVIIGIPNVHKGALTVLQVCKLAEISNPTIRFRIFGEIALDIRDKFEQLSNVCLEGQVPRSRILDYLYRRNSSLGWIPSLTGESYSFALDDFVATNTPVLTSNVGALPERIQNNKLASSYEPNLTSLEIFHLIENFNPDRSH